MLLNKKRFLIFGMVFFIACSGGGGGVASVSSYAELGDCSSMNEGTIRFVSGENKQYRCVDGEWTEYKESTFGESGNRGGMPNGMCSIKPAFVESDSLLCEVETDYKTYIKVVEKCYEAGGGNVKIEPDCFGYEYVRYSSGIISIISSACMYASEMSKQDLEMASDYCDTFQNLVEKHQQLEKYNVSYSCNLRSIGAPLAESLSLSEYLWAATYTRNSNGFTNYVFFSINEDPCFLNDESLEKADELRKFCELPEECDIFGDIARAQELSCYALNYERLAVTYPPEFVIRFEEHERNKQ